MTNDIKISYDDTIENAALTMTRYGISSLIVDNDTQVVGILTERCPYSRCGVWNQPGGDKSRICNDFGSNHH
jgi:hypothetical protein